MRDYLPTTSEVRLSYVDRQSFIRQSFGFGSTEEEAAIEFDTWLDERIREAKKEAWDEGEADGCYNEINRFRPHCHATNPYRKEDA